MPAFKGWQQERIKNLQITGFPPGTRVGAITRSLSAGQALGTEGWRGREQRKPASTENLPKQLRTTGPKEVLIGNIRGPEGLDAWAKPQLPLTGCRISLGPDQEGLVNEGQTSRRGFCRYAQMYAVTQQQRAEAEGADEAGLEGK